ncbi:hypothetical protein AGMMS49574_23990 [Bacteroidia bacterium]|nr:hypothetical protein AGMMS49574_23990 [Bacteroidia bacterium]GHU54894.1 hypothetical protein FACS189411_02340 [Bacteroidia bacterium]
MEYVGLSARKMYDAIYSEGDPNVFCCSLIYRVMGKWLSLAFVNIKVYLVYEYIDKGS